MTWTDLSEDPNSLEVMESRWFSSQELLATADLYRSRDAVFLGAARGRRVLDVGCVDHTGESAVVGRAWLHGKVVETATETVGVDILPEQVRSLVEEGYDVREFDISSGEPVDPTPFEVVLAGEVIEHVPEPLRFLKGLARNVAVNGVVLVSTPNPYAMHRARLGRQLVPWENADHLFYLFPFGMLELGERAGLRLTRIASCDHHRSVRSLLFACTDYSRVLVRRSRQRLSGNSYPNPLMPTAISPVEWCAVRIQRGLRLSGETLVYEFVPRSVPGTSASDRAR